MVDFFVCHFDWSFSGMEKSIYIWVELKNIKVPIVRACCARFVDKLIMTTGTTSNDVYVLALP